METFSALLAICAGNSAVPAQRPVSRSFDVFFDLRHNKRLSKQSWGWWFETLSRPLWRHCHELAQSEDTDIVNVGDMISSKQAIKNNIEGPYKTSLENKMQDTENFPILRTYPLFQQNVARESYIYQLKIIRIELHYQNFSSSSF